VLTSQQLAETATIPMGMRSGLKKTQGNEEFLSARVNRGAPRRYVLSSPGPPLPWAHALRDGGSQRDPMARSDISKAPGLATSRFQNPSPSELSDSPDVCFGMTDFAIDPPVRILGRRGGFVRSTEQAAAFMREHILQHMDSRATEVLRRLEDVRSAEEAQEAAQAFRAWIASGMVATPSGISTKSHALDRSKKASA
jgi:hypothetical protein